MKKSYIKTVMALVLAAFSALFFAGCSPEELELAIKSSAIGKAVSGAYGMANATITFGVETNDIKSKLPKIRAEVMPYLGKDGKMTVRGDKITAKFKVPVVADSYYGSLPERPLARLVLKDGMLKFEATSQLEALNRTLRGIDFSLDVDFKAKHVVFKIIGDSESKCKVSATAVFIDGEAKVNYTAEVGNDDSVDIEFRCDNEASVYHQIQPFIGIAK